MCCLLPLILSCLAFQQPELVGTHFCPITVIFYGMQGWSNFSSSQQQIIRGRDIKCTNQFAGFPNSCNGSKTCPGKCSCLLDRQMGQANTGNHFLIGFRDLGECDVHSSFTDLLIRVSCVSVATAGYLELQSASSQSARKRDRNE